MDFLNITWNVNPEGYTQTEELHRMADSLPSELVPKTWMESIYAAMDLIHRSFANGPFSLNALTMLYGENTTVLDWYIHATNTSLIAELGLKLLQQIPDSSIFIMVIFTVPMLLLVMYLAVMLSLVHWVVQFAVDQINIKYIAESIPPSVGRVEVNPN